MLIYKDTKHRFYELFNPLTGFLVRSNIEGSNDIARIRDFPELIDIGIMGHCHVADLGVCRKAGIDCYQSASNKCRANISFENYKRIIKQCKHRTFQIALGGAGDPNKHEDFENILQFTRDMNIIPNYTTTGIGITDAEIRTTKQYCGAVAVSFYSRLIPTNSEQYCESNPDTITAIKALVDIGCIVNIHYVLSKDTIREALFRIKNDLFPKGIHAVVFLLYKAVGLGRPEKVLSYTNTELNELVNIAQQKRLDYHIGFDTCCTPLIVQNSSNIALEAIDFCDAARFSMYIDCECNCYPCSFACDLNEYQANLLNLSIQDIWESSQFETFRQVQNDRCVACQYKKICLGGCTLGLANLCMTD
jgi:radical SAM additional 4Fe4S-binding domain